MYLLLLTLLGCTCFTFVNGDDRAARYLLPRTVTPNKYDVTLYFDLNNTLNFIGEVSIRVITENRTNEIVLHASGITIARDELRVFHDSFPDENLVNNFTLTTDDTQFLKISLTRYLSVTEPVNINIKYTSLYATNMFGVYMSTFEDSRNTMRLVTSQLQPTYARRAFPCFDEPALKAIFSTTIYAPPAYSVHTNMPHKSSPTIIGDWVRHEFEDTPVMSTYLHGYLVSTFDEIYNMNSTNEEDPIFRLPFKIFSRPSTQGSAEFALDFAQRSMNNLESYYGFNYSLPKLDKVAVPDFAAGAMENWGLCIYREVALLVVDTVTTTANKQNVARLITHENVHLWIGNEVTPVSWEYLWLSEGLATYFDHFAMDFVEPTWRMSEQFLLGVQNGFQADAVLSVNPMTYPVYTPAEVLGTFNAIAYQKSGSVMRMLKHILTPLVFQQGLNYYLHDMTRKAVAPVDLYRNMQKALDESDHNLPYPVEDIIESWANKGGFPVLTIVRSASTANSVTISQERYLTDRALSSTDRWYIPLNWVTSADPNFTDTKPMDWIIPSPPLGNALSIDIPGFSNSSWYIFNKQQTGYYRVNYDVANWVALTNILLTNHTEICNLNRANLLDDAFNLARNGRLNYGYTLNLSQYLTNETDYIAWGAVNPSLAYLDVLLSGTEVYRNFQYYIRNLTEPLYKQLEFGSEEQEEHVTSFLRNIILDLNCRLGNEHCLNTSAALLTNFQENGHPINPDIQTMVYCSSLRGGSSQHFTYFWNIYERTSDASLQSILLNAMGCTSNQDRRNYYMNQVIRLSSPVRDQDRHTVLVSVINSSPEGMAAALEFVHSNFIDIQRNVQGLTGTTNILNAFSRRLTNETHLERINEFENRYESILTAGERASIAAIKENIAASIAWRTQNAATVEAWLKKNYSSSTVNVSSSIILLIIAFASVLSR